MAAFTLTVRVYPSEAGLDAGLYPEVDDNESAVPDLKYRNLSRIYLCNRIIKAAFSGRLYYGIYAMDGYKSLSLVMPSRSAAALLWAPSEPGFLSSR